jgi:integral membrane protein
MTTAQTPLNPTAPKAPWVLRHLSFMTLAEGTTLIALVFIAVPLKYWAGLPIAVKILGPIHGTFFVWAVLVILTAAAQKHLSAGKAAQVFIAALIPFGGLWSHRLIDREIALKTPQKP